MKLSAITLAAVAAFAASQAHAFNVKCNITDNQNNAMVYDFVDAYDDPNRAVAERGYTKNGITTTNDSNQMPYWSVATNTDAHTITFWSRKDRGWGIILYDKYGPAPGNASLQSPSGKIVGNGACAMASSATAPTVETATPSSRPAPGDLSKYLGM